MSDKQEGNVRSHPPADAGALDYVVDDLDARRACEEWVRAELIGGRTAEELAEGLVAAGWPHDDAEGIVEEGRRQTRGERGIVTRDDVVREANRRYRGAMG